MIVSPSPAARSRLAGRAAVLLVLLVPSITVAFWDWTMSLEPEWSSTAYGVYGLAGALQGGIAATAALSARASGGAAARTRHDLGKLLLGFSMLWIYVWFCQLLVIWYANLPDEVVHYAVRWRGGWGVPFWLNPVLGGALPLLVLLPAGTKRHRPTLLAVALVVLGGRWLDVWLLVEPATAPSPTLPGHHLAAALPLLLGAWWLARRMAAGAARDE